MFWSPAVLEFCVGRVLSRSLSLRPGTVTGPRRPLHASRLLCVSASAKSAVTPPREDATQPLRRWALTVSPFGAVRAQLACSISIRSLDPHAFPEADRAFVAVHGTGTEQEMNLEHLHVRYDDRSKELLISAEKVNSSVSVDVTAPIKSSVFISTRGKGGVQVKRMECDTCEVQTEEGDCLLQSIKGHQVEVKSSGGKVTGVGTIHGNVDISTCGDGAVDVKKLQGTKMNVSTERGPLKVKAIYAESSCVQSCSGKVQLGHVHGNATVKNVSGDTLIDGSNSFLKVSSDSGGIDVYVGDGGSAELRSHQGAVCVRVPSSLRVGVELCGASVDVSPEVVLQELERNGNESQTTVIGYLNAESPVDQWVKVQTDRGSVRLKTQSWFESLKLGG